MMRCPRCDEYISEIDPVHVCSQLQPRNNLKQVMEEMENRDRDAGRAQLIKSLRDIKVCIEDDDNEEAIRLINELLGE